MSRPSDETLRLYGITPEERQRNVDQQERQLSTLIDAAEAAIESEPAASEQPAAVDELELAEAFAHETERLEREREARDVLRAAIRRFSPAEAPGKA